MNEEIEEIDYQYEDRDIYTIEEFKEICKDGWFIDYDGSGCFLNSSLEQVDNTVCFDVHPSQILDEDCPIPASATHVEWFNK